MQINADYSVVDGSIKCKYLLLQGYQLGSSQLDFAIQIQVTSTTNASSAATVTETLQLDPSDPYVLDDANLVSAQLLGDLLTYTALPVFTDTYLMIPSPTGEGSVPLQASELAPSGLALAATKL